jgi:phosphopantothenoylcysteine decarboxylase/phosphopantothenate--cysteine ligase
MNCVVTAGPTYEPLDEVRRLTNFSTGRLGTELAAYLHSQGHAVKLLIGEQATYRGEERPENTEIFSTTQDLRQRLKALASAGVGAVFHAAAVSDYTFGRVWLRSPTGEMVEVRSGKISTHAGVLLAELTPTPKIIAEMREWFPTAKLVGWKFEVEGTRDDVIALAKKQIAVCRTDASIANGRAYGEGFGMVTPAGDCKNLADKEALFRALGEFIGEKR